MLFSEFETGMNMLVNAYSDRQFPGSRRELLWKRFEHVNGKLWNSAIEKIVYRMMQPGMVTQFLEETFPRPQYQQATGEARSAFTCDLCRDFGFGWNEHTIVRCFTCERGKAISPEELARQQGFYDSGRRFLKTPADLAKFIGREVPKEGA